MDYQQLKYGGGHGKEPPTTGFSPSDLCEYLY